MRRWKRLSQLEETVLTEIFGVSPETKIIGFFMDFPLNDFMQKEVCEATGLNPRTVSGRLGKLRKLGVLRETRRIGKATLYQLNAEDQVVRKIRELVAASSMRDLVEEEEAILA